MKKKCLTIFLVMMIVFTDCSENNQTGNENYNENQLIGGTEMSKNQDENVTEGITEETTSEKVSEEKQELADRNVYEGKSYKFYKADYDVNLLAGSHNIKNMYDDSEFNYEASYHSLFIGQLLTLFGEPAYWSDNNEDLLSYIIAADDTNGNVIYLEVYYGPSGPAIGGHNGDEYELAANELEKIIMAAEAKDFEVESTYEDVGVTVKMGVKDGKGYYDSIYPEGMFDDF